MNILLIGNGGREHALARQLVLDPQTDALFILPGNPGTQLLGTNVALDPSDIGAVVTYAKAHVIDLVVIGPEAPLVAGLSDALANEGMSVFGPSQAAAQLEGSKSFAKEVMTAAKVPTASSLTCSTVEEVEKALQHYHELSPSCPWVVKDDGLAGGKGVLVTKDKPRALQHASSCINKHHHRVVIEEYLDGPEVSLFCLSDGKNVIPLQPAQDFKRVGDHQTGPNTGGMGAYSPLPWLDDTFVDTVVKKIAQPTIDEMARRNTPFVGLLYCGLALTSQGIKVVEFNARFGDPETQVVITRLKTPLAQLLFQAAHGCLDKTHPLIWSDDAAVCVVIANEGYPEKVINQGRVITGLEQCEQIEGVHIIHCATRRDKGVLYADGGRVLCIVGMGPNIEVARQKAYQGVSCIQFEGSHYRSDIAAQ